MTSFLTFIRFYVAFNNYFRQVTFFSFVVAQGLKARGNVEDWLGKVEEAMFFNLRRLTKAAIGDFETKDRAQWVLDHCSQAILTVSQIIWCRDLTDIFEAQGSDAQRLEGLRAFEQKSFKVRDVTTCFSKNQ